MFRSGILKMTMMMISLRFMKRTNDGERVLKWEIGFIFPTLSCVYFDTPRVFSTKTQHFTPMFLKSVVEVHLFLKGSELSKDKNSESPNFMYFRPETSVGELLKILQIIFSNKLISEIKL